jgi:hypothetical protein
LSIEVLGHLRIGIPIGEPAYFIDDRSLGAPGLVGPRWTGHLQMGAGLGLPADSDTHGLGLFG